MAIRTDTHGIKEAVDNVDNTEIAELLAGVGNVVISNAKGASDSDVLQCCGDEGRNGSGTAHERERRTKDGADRAE